MPSAVQFAVLPAVVLSLAALRPMPTPGVWATHPQAAGTTFTIDPVHSVALFRIQHVGAGQFWGRMNALEGTVVYDAASSTPPALDVTAKLANLDTSSEKLDGNLKGPNFFNAAEFPELRFVSTGGTKGPEGHWRIEGELTIHGVTKPVSVDLEVTGVATTPFGTKAGFEATTTIKRSDFGMTWGVEKPAGVLGDEVRLIVALEGDQAKPAEPASGS